MTFKNSITEVFRKEQFKPSLLGVFINPFYIARKGLTKGVKEHAIHIQGKVLDVGCGRKPYKYLFNVDQYVGMDIELSGHDHADEDIDVYYDGVTFPFDNESFDSALSNQVFEHVFEPENFLSEIHRVLKKDGTLLLTVPFAWDEHEQPYDYARYSSFGLKYILEKKGFEIVKSDKMVNDIRAIFQLLIAYIYKKTLTKSFILNVLFTLVLMAPFTILGQLLYYILPKNNDFYLDNIIVAKKRDA